MFTGFRQLLTKPRLFIVQLEKVYNVAQVHVSALLVFMISWAAQFVT